MYYRIFRVRAIDPDADTAALNAYLASHPVLSVDRQLIDAGENSSRSHPRRRWRPLKASAKSAWRNTRTCSWRSCAGAAMARTEPISLARIRDCRNVAWA